MPEQEEQEYNEKEYKFSTSLNRIKTRGQILDLFDSPLNYTGRLYPGLYKNDHKYFDCIDGTKVLVRFKIGDACKLSTKLKNDLERVKKVALDRLIKSVV